MESGAALGLRERKKRATRAALGEAAVRLAAEHGADHVTVEMISEAAGVSPRTFFNYFASHDDAFVMIDADLAPRVTRAVLAAPAALPPLEALRTALAAELADVENQSELWSLLPVVLDRSPRLFARVMAAQAGQEQELARAIAVRLGHEVAEAADACGGRDTGLYAQLLAGVAGTAVRVSVGHWCAHPETPFAETFHEVFDQLAAGLSAPATPAGTER
ncbi:MULTISPECIES: TetR family transcriptional regulator [Streptomyces]|nr:MULTISPECIES: TetR family transcriptional regulator [Streptomyces]NEE39539.1 TetR family transcriptional regulator [Streptomyces sp. SID7982]PJM81354.1 TetR family transcriptional regulator [Streptomyces sp. TSRI0384-2]QNE84968.1 TetR family transcriptional regulator [Streptomyces rutgersensis]WSU39438.1 TetR family transcriptional regulator [Streptomyces gougerotii]